MSQYKCYPKYKPSGIDWMGEIPESWNVHNFNIDFNFEKGKGAQIFTKEYVSEDGDYPVYSGQTENNGILGYTDHYKYDLAKVIFVTTVGAKAISRKRTDCFSNRSKKRRATMNA